jgi:hypothetical protein
LFEDDGAHVLPFEGAGNVAGNHAVDYLDRFDDFTKWQSKTATTLKRGFFLRPEFFGVPYIIFLRS